MYRAGNSVEQVFGGTVIKQGDRTPLGFNFRDENGELVNLTGTTIQIKMASNKGVVVEKQATISDQYTVTFSLGEEDITGAGDMMIEFIVTYSSGLQEKFPSDDWQRIRITPTLENVEQYGVGYITFEKLTGEFKNQFDEFKGGVGQQIDDQKKRVDNLISSTPQPSEVVDARRDESGNGFINLKAHLDDKGKKIGSSSGLPSWLQKSLYDVSKQFDDHIRDFGINVRRPPYNAYGDNLSHPLSSRFSTLAQAQAVFPKVTALTQEIDWAALQTAIDDAMTKGKSVLVPDGFYVTADELGIGSSTNMKPVELVGMGSSGSFLGEKPVIITRKDGTTHTLIKALGRGLNIRNICLDGKNAIADLMQVDRGFEMRLKDVRFYRAEGYGLLAKALSNSRLQDVHFDVCGSSTKAALRITGNQNYEYSSNTTHMNNVHIERSRGTDLDLAYGTNVDDICEFILIDGLHIEGTIDNTNGAVTAYKTVPHLRIGNVRGVEIVNSFIYGGKGVLISYEKQRDIGASVGTGVSISNTYLMGHLTSHAIDSATPDRLIDLVSGDGFTLMGGTLDTALVEHIRIQSGFGSNVNIITHYAPTRSGASAVKVNDLRTGSKSGITPNHITVGDGNAAAMLRINIERAWTFAQRRGTGSSAELNLRPEGDGKTFSIDTFDGTKRVLTVVSSTSNPQIGFFDGQSGKQTVTGSRGGNAALDSLLQALASYGIITNNTTS
ncbi:hypothetical protein [Priestia megaterium]|uniref:hypothetical protein n=1 Tax=Priestia megaterium TaxID=1404 RepID=UPI0023DB2BFC|nr:hypothetical protein [Priestia megaterium]MDF2056293.1 hypothetical protein [Priestia megaterium]MDF2060255.1 hypothetical protein [Priestia megaterium]